MRTLALLLATALAGCVTISTSSVGTFAGVMPCADCAGILTELRLYAEQPSGRPARYELTETYLGSLEGDRSISRTGRWGTTRGAASDPGSTVVQLDLGRPDMPRNLLRVGEDELRLLDLKRQEIVAVTAHTLYRVSDLPAATLTEGDSEQTIEVERGQRVFVVLGANRSAGYGWMLDAPGKGPLTRLGDPIYAQGAVPGAGGTEVWLFRAGEQGRQELRFEYRRPSQRGEPPAKTVTYTLSVH
jgi:copper homeostasis protein (lipoprotein)